MIFHMLGMQGSWLALYTLSMRNVSPQYTRPPSSHSLVSDALLCDERGRP
jgi:hypothetical protein